MARRRKRKRKGTFGLSVPRLTAEENNLLRRYLKDYIKLEGGQLEPTTEARKHFIRVCLGLETAMTPHERAYMKWKRIQQAEQRSQSEDHMNRIPEYEEGYPRPGWFPDEDWRANRGRQRYDGPW